MGEFGKNGGELHAMPPSLENGQYRAGTDISPPERELEFSRPPREPANDRPEYFGEEKKPKKRDNGQKKKQGLMAKMLAATASLTAAVTAVAVTAQIAVATQILIAPPEFCGATVTDYVAEVSERVELPNGEYDDIYEPPHYNVCFQFALNDAAPDALNVTVTGRQYDPMLIMYDPENAVSVPISYTVPAEDMEIDENGVLTAEYPVENAYLVEEVQATLRYEVRNEAGEPEERGEVTTELFNAGYSHFYVLEGQGTQNTLETVIEGDVIHCTATFRDYRKGAVDFRVENLIVTQGEETFYYGPDWDATLPSTGLTVQEDTFVYTFDVPRPPESDAMLIAVEIDGDCYLNGEKMNLTTHTSVEEYVIWGEAYAVHPIDMSRISETVNGLRITEISYSSDYKISDNGFDKVLPGSTVYVYFLLEGVAAETGSMFLKVSNLSDTVLEYDDYWCRDIFVEAGEEYMSFELSFVMPAGDVTSEVLAVESLVFTPSGG